MNSVEVLGGIDAINRYDRAQEELKMLQLEWSRVVKWTKDKLYIILLVWSYYNELPGIKDMLKADLMDLIILAESLLGCQDTLVITYLKNQLAGTHNVLNFENIADIN